MQSLPQCTIRRHVALLTKTNGVLCVEKNKTLIQSAPFRPVDRRCRYICTLQAPSARRREALRRPRREERVKGRGHIVGAGRLQLVIIIIMLIIIMK